MPDPAVHARSTPKRVDRMELSQQVHDAGREVASATGETLPGILNEALGRFLGWPFKAASGRAADRAGHKTETFASVVYTAPAGAAAPDPQALPADTVAAVIDACESLDLESLRAAYERIAQAKRLTKAPAPCLSGTPVSTITLGIIFSLRAAIPLETFAAELQRLNAQTPSDQWPDMVAVASTGAIHYAVQFPGESLVGGFLPPAKGATAAYTPPMYILIVMSPTGAYTFNKMTAFLIAHLAFFSPGAKLPNTSEILPAAPQQAVTVSGYQYNLRGALLPVPRQFYNDRYLPPPPMRIEDQQGNLLSTIQFLPWQDGGTILLKGKLPLDGLLIFLDREVLRRAGVVKRPPDLQISYVLPITQADFNAMLTRIHQQWNMIVRPDQTKWVVQKVGDEGTRSPFIARILLGVLCLRDMVYPDPAKCDNFDKAYEFVTSSLLNARTAAQQILQLWGDHVRKVASGEIAGLKGRVIHIEEDIHKELKKEVESFLNAAARALQRGMQDLATELQVNIGFLFQQQTPFETGLAALQTTDPLLAEYLRQTRTWSEPLIETRIALEHKRWMLPRVTYSDTGSGIKADEPLISGQPVSEFVKLMLDRLACFVEELTAHCLQRRMPAEITITEIPLARRPAEAPERFQVTLARGGMPPWTILYHHSSFEET